LIVPDEIVKRDKNGTLTPNREQRTIRIPAMKCPAIGFVVLGAVLSCPLWLSGQAAQPPAKLPAASSVSEDHYPDQGFLSSSRYTNRYFGFAFDLPPEAGLEPIPLHAATDSRIQLLQLAGPPSADAAISVAAFPVAGKNGPDAKTRLRHDLDQELFVGVEELHGLTKTTIAGHQFYTYETRRGIEQHVAMAINLDNYVVVFFLGSHNEKILRQLESSFRQIVFFPPAEALRYAGADAQDYEGPAISAHRLAQLRADPPARHIDPGRVQGSSYENPTLGFLYRIPDGWTLEPQGAVESAFEDANSKPDIFDPVPAGRAEHELMKICNRTLFSAWAKRPEADGQIPYDDFGEVTVSAAPAACFPGIKFPTDSSDRQAVKGFLLQFSLTHPMVREMRDANAFSSGGNVFIFLHGTVALRVSQDALSRRLSVGMSITQRRGYVLTWFFAAPHDSEMKDLLEERVAFDPGPPIKEPVAAKPGGGAPSPAADVLPSEPSETTAAAPPQTEPASKLPAGPTAASNTNATPATPAEAPQPTSDVAADTSSKPSLLRPGETMEDQQINGKPAPKHPKK